MCGHISRKQAKTEGHKNAEPSLAQMGIGWRTWRVTQWRVSLGYSWMCSVYFIRHSVSLYSLTNLSSMTTWARSFPLGPSCVKTHLGLCGDSGLIRVDLSWLARLYSIYQRNVQPRAFLDWFRGYLLADSVLKWILLLQFKVVKSCHHVIMKKKIKERWLIRMRLCWFHSNRNVFWFIARSQTQVHFRCVMSQWLSAKRCIWIWCVDGG